MSTSQTGSQEQMLTLLNGLAGKARYYVAKMASPASVRESGNITIINSRISSDSFNCVISRGLEERAGVSAIADICASFNAAALPAAWWTCDEIRPEFVARELAKHHFIEDETNVGMLAELDAIPRPDSPAGFEVRVVDSAAGVLEHGRLLASLADPPDPHTLAYYTAISEIGDFSGQDRQMRLFTGYLDGQPVSTASLSLDGDTGHIFDVSTTSASRGRGLGTAMMAVVLEHARELGARRAGLQASEDGIGVYRRMSFEPACLFRVYSNRLHIAAQEP